MAFLNVYPASLVGVMSAVFAAIAYLSVNKLSKRHHNYEIVFYFLFIATLISLPLMWERLRLAQRLPVCHPARHRPYRCWDRLS